MTQMTMIAMMMTVMAEMTGTTRLGLVRKCMYDYTCMVEASVKGQALAYVAIHS